MPLRPLASLAAFSALSALSGPASAACVGARVAPGVAEQPAPWRRAVEALVRSTGEPGHPWSCAGGEIDLLGSGDEVLLVVRREGDARVARRVSSPDEVLPLGQALLALPAEPDEPAPPASTNAPPPPAAPPAVAARAPAAPLDPRMLVRAAVDAHYAGGARLAWVGPELSAAVPLGSWLPQVSLRYQTSVTHRRPPVDEVGAGVALLRRWGVSWGELRAGGSLAVAGVVRDLPRPAGAQVRLDVRPGLVAAAAVPVWRSLRLVLALDGEVALLKRTRGETPPAGSDPAFPTYTLGGSLGAEVPL